MQLQRVGDRLMYAALYGYTKGGEYREHLGNVTNIEYTVNERVYDFGSAKIKGVCDFITTNALIYVINTENGKAVSSGFAKNIKPLEGNALSFDGDDFKRILDTDILIDFTGEAYPNFSLQSIFTRVANGVQEARRDGYMSKIALNFILPNDTTDTTVIADYTGQYIIVNALKFLKIYLSYFGYYIKPTYNVATDEITFAFTSVNLDNVTDIKLKDFKHESTSSDIKVNKTVATLTFSPEEFPPVWEDSTLAYFNSQPDSNRAEVVQEAETLPPTTGYSPGFALKVIGQPSWTAASRVDYQASSAKRLRRVIVKADGPCSGVPVEVAMEAVGNPAQYDLNSVIMFSYGIMQEDGSVELCTRVQYQTYLKIVKSTSISYYKLGAVTYSKRPDLPERVYLLGKDNQIYEGYNSIAETNRIYPIVAKIFEAQYLAAAQVNAVYEIVNNRYLENIIIDAEKVAQPVDLAVLGLYNIIRCYDDEGSYKELPISEKTTILNKKENRTEIKLGFKKTLLTEVIKNDVGIPDVIKTSGGGGSSTTIIEQSEPWTGGDAPDPDDHNTWFKPLGEVDELQVQTYTVETEPITVDPPATELTVTAEPATELTLTEENME